MTPDEIIEIAAKAGMRANPGYDTADGKHWPAVAALSSSVPREWLERFAALVAAKEREACAQIAGVAAYSVRHPSEDHAMTPKQHAKAPTLAEVYAFLDGSGELEGCWFGEKPEYEKGEFWWRSRLQAAISAEAQAVPQSDAISVLRSLFPDLCHCRRAGVISAEQMASILAAIRKPA